MSGRSRAHERARPPTTTSVSSGKLFTKSTTTRGSTPSRLPKIQSDELEDHTLRGVDAIAATAARARGLAVVVFRADWAARGKYAGPYRNAAMADYSDRARGFRVPRNRRSRGTDNCEAQFIRRRKPVEVTVAA